MIRQSGFRAPFEIDRTYNGLPSPRIRTHASTGSSGGSITEVQNKPSSLCVIPVATFQARCRCHFGEGWPFVN
jgi:hypothetical protein